MTLIQLTYGHVSAVVIAETILLLALLSFASKLYRARSVMLALKKRGLPMPPYHPLFGHLGFVYRIASQLPKDAHPQYLPDMIRRELPDLGPLFYLDTWPFGPQMLVVASPGSLHQITQQRSLPKYHALKSFLLPIADGFDIVTMEGKLWKKWRSIFNPGFSASHLVTLTSGIVEETATFCEILGTHLNNRAVFQMKDLTDFLAMDVIGRVVMNTQLGSQRHSNPLVDGLRSQIRWLTFGAEVNPFVKYNPLRPLVHRFNKWRMDRYASAVVDALVANFEIEKRTKSIIDLALTAYVSDESENNGEVVIDSMFKTFALSQIKLFLFSGHDTTSSSICYLFYLLAQEAGALSLVRAEHDKVFGSDLDATQSLIIKDPSLLNKIPYTLAIIKETLRLYPAVSSTRAGEPDFDVVDDGGRHFPTDGFLVWANPQTIQRDPAYWPDPDRFIPERWLVPPGDRLYPIKGAWRPFEHGPRNCIAQELAIVEMKIVLVMVLRIFKIEPAYENLDRDRRKGIKTVYGERGYQIQRAQPSENFPCRISKVMREKRGSS